VPYASLPKAADHKNLSKLAVLKVNGGLGTSMGVFPKTLDVLVAN
jgi:UTP--glucose-1-phosphate uridylyltransferase